MAQPDRGLPSTEDQCATTTVDVIRSLKLPGYQDGRLLEDSDVQEREDWYTDDTPHRGISVHTVPERYGPESPLGLQDVAYGVAVTAAVQRSGTANNPNRLPRRWLSVVRQRFQQQRIPVGDELNGGVRRNYCTVTSGSPKIPRRKQFRNWTVRQVIIWFWVREAPDSGE
jgi:hypothetical protein